jgi:hypothetical protein
MEEPTNQQARIKNKVIQLKNEKEKNGYTGRMIWNSLIEFFFNDITKQATDYYNNLLADQELKATSITVEELQCNINTKIKPLIDIYVKQLDSFNMGNIFGNFPISQEDLEKFQNEIEKILANHIRILQANYKRILDESRRSKGTWLAAWIAAWAAIILGLLGIIIQIHPFTK